jgi:hypothetical protein
MCGPFTSDASPAMECTLPLRDDLLEVCRASGADVNEVAQALVDALQITLIVVGPDADAAERNIRNIATDMLDQIHKSYAEYHAMVEARRQATN